MYYNIKQKHSRRSVSNPIREKGFMLGSHLRAGLYEPVDSSISGLLKQVYDADDTPITDVDPLCDYSHDKFSLARLGRKINVSDIPKQEE